MRPYRHIDMFKYQIKRVLLKINVVVYSLLFISPSANQTNLCLSKISKFVETAASAVERK